MRTPKLVIGAISAVWLLGCNMLTGADQFVVDDETAAGDDDPDNDGGDSSGGGSSSGGNASVGGSTGDGNSTGEGAGGPVAETGDATGFSIREVAFYQAVKSTVFANGANLSPTVALVANRPAVVRVFVDTSGTSGASVTARLTIGNNPPLEQTVGGNYASSDAEYGSTINFDVPAAYMAVGGSWRVQLLEPVASSTANPAASTPDSPLAVSTSHPVRVTLVPVIYGADGSNRAPDTSQGQVDLYRAYFMTLYPATDVVISVGQPLTWNSAVSANGAGWEELLNEVSSRRMNANVAFDEYYYGIFEPASSFGNYCGGGCVAGLGFIGDPGGEYSRAAIGLGYSGDVAMWTAVHEVGHNHGRPHSPCGGVSGADPAFPNAGGSIGTWGMDIFGHQMVPPSYKDFMGYCDANWISDYVYEEVLSFMQDTGGAQSFYVPPEERDQPYERINVGGTDAGTATWLDPITLARPPLGTVQELTITLADGSTRTVEGTMYAYDHLPGGVVFVKSQEQAITSMDLHLRTPRVTRELRVSR